MDRNESIGLTILGATILGLFYLNQKINRCISIQAETLEVVDKMLDIDIQERVDEQFAEIVENLDE